MPQSRKARKMCYDKILPQDLHKPHRMMAMENAEEAIAPIGKQWSNGRTITIAFLGGTAADQELVKKHAVQWTKHANLNFEFVNHLPADIRIAFDSSDGAWSYVGTDNLGIASPGPTMNLGWVDEEVILHEFGHMIGLGHEHQNPDGGIEWDEATVIAELAGPPNFWPEATTRHNVLRKYSSTQVNGTNFDPQSIMLYAFPGSWTRNRPDGTQSNHSLSTTDKAFVASSVMYPGRNGGAEISEELVIEIAPVTASSIRIPGAKNQFRFVVSSTGVYVVETTGPLDLKLSLFGPNSDTNLLAHDDDSGTGANSRIRATLSPGEYIARVEAFDRNTTGNFAIHVLKAA